MNTESKDTQFKLTADNFTQMAFEYLCELIEERAKKGHTSMDITKYEPSKQFINFLHDRGFKVESDSEGYCIYW